jgi:hypothetical protein
MEKYTYFVSYQHGNAPDNVRFGMAQVVLDRKIESFADILEVAHMLRSKANIGQVVILNYQLLSYEG